MSTEETKKDELERIKELEDENETLGQYNADLAAKIGELEHDLENQKAYAKGLQTKLKKLGKDDDAELGSKVFSHS